MKYGSLNVEIHGNQRVSLIQSWNFKQPVVLWLFQLDDSKSLHKKWLFHQTSIKKWLFRVPGCDKDGISYCFEFSALSLVTTSGKLGPAGFIRWDETTCSCELSTKNQLTTSKPIDRC